MQDMNGQEPMGNDLQNGFGDGFGNNFAAAASVAGVQEETVEAVETLLSPADYQYELLDGDVLQLQATPVMLDALIAMQCEEEKPQPPVQDANYGGVIKQETNETDEDYLKALQDWENIMGGRIGMAKLMEGVVLSETQLAEAERYKKRMKRLTIEFPDEPELIYLTAKKLSTEQIGELGQKIDRISRPTETVVQRAGEG